MEIEKKTYLDGHREGERGGDVPPLDSGLKLIGPGLEEIIFKNYRKKLYKALHRSGFHGDSLLWNSATATGRENKISCCPDTQEGTNRLEETELKLATIRSWIITTVDDCNL